MIGPGLTRVNLGVSRAPQKGGISSGSYGSGSGFGCSAGCPHFGLSHSHLRSVHRWWLPSRQSVPMACHRGPGRHGPGDNVFAYFCGPDEVPLEYTAEVLQIDDAYEPHPSSYWKYAPGRSDQWGITQPRSARYYRVQRLFGFTADGDRLA